MKEKFSFDPLADFQNYRHALRKMVEGGWVLPRDLMPSALNAIVIPVDVLDNGPEIVVKASLAGVKPEDVSISVLGDTLTIKATMDEENENRGATYLRRERKANAFVRTINLPVAVEAGHADARYKNGVLTLILPKIASTRPRVIRVMPE
ncbi:MAG: Hsp20 family protein [Anaerolineaceae bacterium]|nr:Hsp20 family protein [Anaerolineaceae bacterium]